LKRRLAEIGLAETEHKHVEEVLIASEVRFRRLFETAKDGILIIDADTGNIIDVNPFLVNLLGYSHDEFIGKKLWEIGAFEDIRKVRPPLKSCNTKNISAMTIYRW